MSGGWNPSAPGGMMPPGAEFRFRGAIMTAEEFRRQAEPLLNPDKFVPIAVDLSTGDRVFIDMPEQAELRGNQLLITRRGRRFPEKYGYDVIERVIPADRLPPDPGGISYAEFDTTIRQLLTAEPFRPFVIELRNGDRIELHERAGTVRAGRVVVIPFLASRPVLKITYDQIARITTAAEPVRA